MTSLRPAPRRTGTLAPEVRTLDDADYPLLRALVDSRPLVNAVFVARLEQVRSADPRRLGGSVLAVDADDHLRAAAFAGGSVLPLGGEPDGHAEIAVSLAAQSRICSSIVGPRAAVAAMEPVLFRAWGRPRAIRGSQPLLAVARDVRPTLPSAHPGLHCPSLRQFDSYLEASVAMFTEELGASPLTRAGAAVYRRRVRDLITDGRAFAVTGPDGDVLFKADIGAVTPQTCQVQGVWVRPDLRGRGLATAALAGVLRHALALAPTVSLYVNDFNLPARRLYARLGMQQVDELRTVLF